MHGPQRYARRVKNGSISGPRRFTPQERARWVGRYRVSGLTQRGFAERHGLPVSTLHQWLHRNASRGEAESAAFEEVHLRPTPRAHPWTAEVSFSDGTTLRLSDWARAPWIDSLLQSLGKSC
jgi:transposase-like protein